MAVRTTITPSCSAPDVQASVPATQVSLSRVGVTGVEKVIRVKADGAENLYHADFECFVDLKPRQAGVHMSRFEEIVGEAIDEVVLGEAFRAEVLAAHIAQRVRERQRRPARRGLGRGALPGDGEDAGQRPLDAGDLRAVRDRGRLRTRDADADRSAGAGDDRLPLRAGDGRRAGPRTARRGRLRPRAGRAGDRGGAGGDAQPTRRRHPVRRAAPRAAKPGSTRRSCCASSRAR